MEGTPADPNSRRRIDGGLGTAGEEKFTEWAEALGIRWLKYGLDNPYWDGMLSSVLVEGLGQDERSAYAERNRVGRKRPGMGRWIAPDFYTSEGHYFEVMTSRAGDRFKAIKLTKLQALDTWAEGLGEWVYLWLWQQTQDEILVLSLEEMFMYLADRQPPQYVMKGGNTAFDIDWTDLKEWMEDDE